MAGVVDALKHFLDRPLVLLVARANEEVHRRVDALGQLAELRRVSVDQFLRTDTLALSGLSDRLAMLIGPREEEDLLPALAHVPGKDVRRDRRVRMAEMRLGVHVVDRRRQEVSQGTSDAIRPRVHGSRPASVTFAAHSAVIATLATSRGRLRWRP